MGRRQVALGAAVVEVERLHQEPTGQHPLAAMAALELRPQFLGLLLLALAVGAVVQIVQQYLALAVRVAAGLDQAVIHLIISREVLELSILVVEVVG